ncbi:LysR family transcriptional regulator [Silanimonas sp.]|jgi:LysR family nitrogen assimilation transcriptional regulator|uniref:LysR family transcriptional regulator n=1 Tax=Silanimonas sp. TaxID=1929290 RepID=UPI0022CAD502|nr:LysR family transcriptional regulator [Silanimonas sp.]MCZ8116195.1 LysR family transcriptional regulator [Silanimonas sp.]
MTVPVSGVELRQLEYFLAVVEAESISRAAISLSITQSGLSRQIGALESALGVVLFERTGRGVTLTDPGRDLLPYARNVVAQVREAEEHLRGLRTTPTGRVVLGATPLVASIITAPVIEAARRRYPGVALEVMESSAAVLGEWVGAGRADLAVTYAPPEQFGGLLDGEKLADDALWLVGDASLAAEWEGLPFARAAALPLILPTRQSGMRRRIDALATELGVSLNVVLEVDSLAATVASVSSGLGITILPRLAAAPEVRLRGLQAVPLVEPTVPGWLSLYVARARGASYAVKAVTGLIRQQARSLFGPPVPR